VTSQKQAAAGLPEEEARQMSYHVKRVREPDPGADPEQEPGAAPPEQEARYSRAFRSRAKAQREADAWNREGDFSQYWPVGGTAEVLPGRPPRQASRDADREAGS
jgi:hypothetical protein